jgi:drug/metabolite transporter (DMT)-like permease
VLLAASVAGLLPLQAPRTAVVLVDVRMSWVVPVLGLSLVAASVAYVTGVAGARRLGAKLASFVGLTEVLFAVGFAWVLLGQRPTSVQLAGGVLVVAGIALVRLDELRAPEDVLPPAGGSGGVPSAVGRAALPLAAGSGAGVPPPQQVGAGNSAAPRP